MTHPIKAPRKLIEVALPLDDINEQAAREKSIRHGHPSTLHLWWARRPLAAARAVIFAQLVNDPSWKWELENPGVAPPPHVKGGHANARRHLFALISELVKWENTNNEELLEKARSEIRKSWRETCEVNRDHPEASTLFNPDKLPGLHDPFAGGGTIPLEAQRLGLEAFASDLNPVAVLINKAMIEIPPKFAGRPPVHPEALRDPENFGRVWKGAQGLAEDVRRYGAWMRDEAEKRIGHLYPKVKVTAELAADRPDLQGLVGQELTVIAWLWARTVKSPNPAFSHVDVPLVSSFVLSPMQDKAAWIEPLVEGDQYRFMVRMSQPPEGADGGTKIARGSFRCIFSDAPLSYEYIDDEANAGRLGHRLMAVVAEGNRGRTYLSPDQTQEEAAGRATPTWKPNTPSRGTWASNAQGRYYGFKTFGDYFTARQLVALTTFSDLVGEASEQARRDAISAGLSEDAADLNSGGIGASAYGAAVATYLAFLVSKLADKGSSLCTWDSGPTSNRTATGRSARVATVRVTFGRQGLAMSWDYAEVNFFSDSVGSIDTVLKTMMVPLSLMGSGTEGSAQQVDVQSLPTTPYYFVSTDPPYYDNIGYADLSEFFYVWLRRALRQVYPSLFATIAVPKAEELIATPYRHGSKEKAERFFLDGMTVAMRRIAEHAHPGAPVTVYYAFKQSETKGDAGTSSTGWETFLEALMRAGFALTGTWPMRTEMGSRMVGSGTNALASSIVLVCRRRPADAPTASRRDFQRALDAILPVALDTMTRGTDEDRSPVAPVDLSQAIIGPGMAVFSRYAAVIEADGRPMSVKTALQLINRFLAEDDFDAGTQFCLRWFEQHGWGEGAFGEADVLARAKATSVDGLKRAGVLFSDAGKVSLRRAGEYPEDWDPTTDTELRGPGRLPKAEPGERNTGIGALGEVRKEGGSPPSFTHSASARMPVWEALHQLVRVFRKDGEQGAGRLLSAVQSKTEPIRQLAYRLYTLCERLGHADDARGYNELVAAWSGVETVASAAPEPKAKAAQLNLFGE